MTRIKVPKEATQALAIIEELLGGAVMGVYLYGSAVAGGLRNDSDVDILAVVNHGLPEETRKKLIDRLLPVSGKIGNADGVRSLEVTVINHGEIAPWRYPPRKEFIYGEWLRQKYEQGYIPEPAYDSDLAIILYQVRNNSISLAGHDAPKILDPVPMTDVRKAMKDCLPELMSNLMGDERNVILTLARMWATADEGKILPKDAAAKWAMHRLGQDRGALLAMAGKAYRGECVDQWEGFESELAALAEQMIKEIEACFNR